MPALSEPITLAITRTLNAPIALVWECWTQARHLARWGGAPEQMTAVAEHEQIRKGGQYRVHLDHENGDRFTVVGRYLEVDKPVKLVFTHAWLGANGVPGPEMLVILTFKEVDGRTRMTLRQKGFESTRSRDGHKQGWGSQLDRFMVYVNGL
jgi:uncharacterized protein YndB with AHSA1/START domain